MNTYYLITSTVLIALLAIACGPTTTAKTRTSYDPIPVIQDASITPTPGENQDFRLAIAHPEHIDAVTAVITTDHARVTITLTRASNTTVGVYEAVWHVNDTHQASYNATFVAHDERGWEFDITLPWTSTSP
jgi:hypothetical protein